MLNGFRAPGGGLAGFRRRPQRGDPRTKFGSPDWRRIGGAVSDCAPRAFAEEISLTESAWLQHEGNLKWALLLGAFVTFAFWETVRPRKILSAPTGRRWTYHAILAFLFNSPLIWLLRANAILVALAVTNTSFGVLNRPFLPYWLRCVLSVLLLDLFRYAQHRLYHSMPVFWRIHRVHHSDLDFDWSTGLLFHPAELLLTQGSYLALIALLAPPPLAVLGLELFIVVQNLFVHANIAMPDWLDARLRTVLITPDMHRIHHSEEVVEQNTNFGDVFPWWDRLFGTYVERPAAGHQKMKVGLQELPGPPGLNVLEMLALPFRRTGTLQDPAAPGSVKQNVAP